MVELIEYVIAFGISAGVAGASVMLVSGAIPGLGIAAASSKADQIAGAARLAISEGRDVTLFLPLKSASLSCSNGMLDVSVGGLSRTYAVNFPCTFAMQRLSGACNLLFSSYGGSLGLQVSC